MKRRLRFGVKALLVATAFVAALCFVFQLNRRLNAARENLEIQLALFEVNRVHVADVLDAARAAYDVEWTTFWIPDQRAASHYQDVLGQLIERQEGKRYEVWDYEISYDMTLEILRCELRSAGDLSSSDPNAIHIRCVEQQLTGLEVDIQNLAITDSDGAYDAIDMLHFVQSRVPLGSYRVDAAKGNAIATQRAKIEDALLAILRQYAKQDVGVDAREWHEWLMESRKQENRASEAETGAIPSVE